MFVLKQGIENMLLSSDYQKYRDLEILTTDSQFSLNGGVIVLVTGYLTGDDKVRRKFTQTFFLAPQQHGYFVLNDIFKYLDVVPDNVVESTPEAPVPSNHGMLYGVCDFKYNFPFFFGRLAFGKQIIYGYYVISCYRALCCR